MSKLVPGVSAFLVGCGLVATPFAARPAHAQVQEPAQEAIRLGGVVADERTLTPVGSAKVTILGTDLETVSASNGTFAFSADELPLGPVTVRVDAEGFPAMVEEVVISEDAVVFVQFILPTVDAFLDEILVLGRRSGREASLAETRTAADLLVGQLPGININPGIVGLDHSDVHLRGVNSIMLRGEPPIYLDGARMAGTFADALSILRQIPANDIRDVQLLRGPASAFLQGSADGVIMIRTRSGSPSQEPDGRD
jgi:outer membrane receptor protein involved in Fe transport